MTNSAETLVINSVDHRYIFPVVLIVLFGVILVYNIYGLIAQREKIKKLSEAERMIIEGHKKLVDNREELFVENGNALDANFMLNEIEEIDNSIKNIDPEKVEKEARKAEIRRQKSEARNKKAIEREENKKRRIEERKAKKLTPEKQRRLQAKKMLTYEAAYNVLSEAANRRINEMEDLIRDNNKKNEKRYAYVDAKYKNSALIAIQKEEAKKKAKRHEAAVKKKAMKEAKKASSRADISLFSENDV